MRVLYVAPRYHTNQTAVMEGWIKNGDEVCLLSHYVGKVEDHSLITPLVLGYSKIFSLIEWSYMGIMRKKENAMDFRLKYGIPPVLKLNKELKIFSPELVITRERSVYSILVTLFCRFHHYPVILYNQSPLWENDIKRNFLHKLIYSLTPSYRITPVFSLGKIAGEKKRDRNAFFLPFLMNPNLDPTHKKYFAEDYIHVFAVGKYQERKNHLMLIEVLEELSMKYPLRLVIAGEVSNNFHEAYYQKVRQYITANHLENSVELKVNLTRKDIFDHYRNSDLFVLCSTDEPAAVSHLEAMSFSLPVISGENNGTASYVEEGINGYICRDNNKEDLKNKIEAIITDREKLKQMGAESYRLVCEKYQFDSYYKKILEILERIKQEK